jgi:hypothetical protein
MIFLTLSNFVHRSNRDSAAAATTIKSITTKPTSTKIYLKTDIKRLKYWEKEILVKSF